MRMTGLAPFTGAAGRPAVGRHEAEARPRLRAGARRRGCCCSTSRPSASTRCRAASCGASSTSWSRERGHRACCWAPPTSTRPSAATRWCCCTTGELLGQGPPRPFARGDARAAPSRARRPGQRRARLQARAAPTRGVARRRWSRASACAWSWPARRRPTGALLPRRPRRCARLRAALRGRASSTLLAPARRAGAPTAAAVADARRRTQRRRRVGHRGARPAAALRRLLRGATASASTCAAARSSACSAPTAPARSTTFRMLCGLLPAERRRPCGRRRRPAPRRRGGAGADRLHVAEVLALRRPERAREPAVLRRRLRSRRRARSASASHWALDEFELAPLADRRSGELPLGYKQRLALACALMHEPRDPVPRRADLRRRSAGAARVLAPHQRAGARRASRCW